MKPEDLLRAHFKVGDLVITDKNGFMENSIGLVIETSRSHCGIQMFKARWIRGGPTFRSRKNFYSIDFKKLEKK